MLVLIMVHECSPRVMGYGLGILRVTSYEGKVVQESCRSLFKRCLVVVKVEFNENVLL